LTAGSCDVPPRRRCRGPRPSIGGKPSPSRQWSPGAWRCDAAGNRICAADPWWLPHRREPVQMVELLLDQTFVEVID